MVTRSRQGSTLGGTYRNIRRFLRERAVAQLSGTPSVTKARDVAREVGLHFVYTGNIQDEAGQSTYCRAVATG
jgi:hypothetical protein